MKTGIWKYEEVEKQISTLHDKKIVLAGGCFDLLHYGHFTFLQNAKKEGDILIIALESDAFITEKKKRKPIHTQMQRAEILASLHMVDYVILLPYFTSDAEYTELVSKVNPSVIAITGGDSKKDKKENQSKTVNAELKVVSSLLPEFSTTQITTNEDIFSN